MGFDDALVDMGFRLDRDARGVRHYVATPNPYLAYSVQAHPDGSALFSWEFAIAEYAATLGMQVGSGEQLNTFLFPRSDERGPQDAAWVASQVERTEARLRAFSLLDA